MGMYDRFLIATPCPNCGTILEEWQTKDLRCLLENYRVGDFIDRIKPVNVYTSCSSGWLIGPQGSYFGDTDNEGNTYCGASIDAKVLLNEGKIIGLEITIVDMKQAWIPKSVYDRNRGVEELVKDV